MHADDVGKYEGPPCELCKTMMFVGTCTHRPRKREAEFYRRLQEQGLWIPRTEQPPPPMSFEPVKVEGKPVSQEIIDDRG